MAESSVPACTILESHCNNSDTIYWYYSDSVVTGGLSYLSLSVQTDIIISIAFLHRLQLLLVSRFILFPYVYVLYVSTQITYI